MQCLKLSNTKKALSIRSLTTAWKVLCERLVLSNRKPSMLLLKLLCELRIQGRWPGIWVLVLTALLAVWLWAVYLSIPFIHALRFIIGVCCVQALVLQPRTEVWTSSLMGSGLNLGTLAFLARLLPMSHLACPPFQHF